MPTRPVNIVAHEQAVFAMASFAISSSSTVWGPEYGDEREYLRTYILQLRRKFEEDPTQPTYLKTVNYLGYVFLDTAEQGT